jgi:hypothetical protein
MYICWDCLAKPDNKKDMMGEWWSKVYKSIGNALRTALRKHSAFPVRAAGYPGTKGLLTTPNFLKPTERESVCMWLNRRYGLDLRTKEAWLEQARKDGGTLKALYLQVDTSPEAAGRADWGRWANRKRKSEKIEKVEDPGNGVAVKKRA